MSLTEQDRKALVDYRIEKAYNDMEDARVLLEAKRYEGAANRLYYAVFHIVSALLLTQHVEAKTHDGIKQKFLQLYVKTQKCTPEQGQLYIQLMELRQTGDYTDRFYLQPEEVLPLVEPAKALMAKIERMIKEQEENR